MLATQSWIRDILVWIRIRGSVPLTGLGRWIRNLAPYPDPALLASVAEPRAEEPKLNCLLELEPKLRVAAPAPFCYSKT
jgi:hypothetical protein